jgi:hypothetical protein
VIDHDGHEKKRVHGRYTSAFVLKTWSKKQLDNKTFPAVPVPSTTIIRPP